MTESYETIRDSELLTQETREAYVLAEQSRRNLRSEYEALIADETLNDDYKVQRAQELYEQRAKNVESAGRKARELLLKQAQAAEQVAIPRPKGESLSSSDATKLVADQNEASRIVRTVERRKTEGGPFRQNTGEMLRGEYARGLEIGGLEGGAVCRGTLRAADELGVSPEEVIDPLRGDAHREAADRARRFGVFADTVSEKAPTIPRQLDRSRPRRIAGNYSAAPSILGGAQGPPIVTSQDSASGGAKKKKSGRRKASFK